MSMPLQPTPQQQSDASTTAASEAGPSDITNTIPPNATESASRGEPAAAAEAAELGECVICLSELDESPTTTLICNHTFHSACVTEWLNKDGRCPTCRRQIRPVTVAQVQTSATGPEGLTHQSMHNMAMMMLESRRLMMLATMEAALAVGGHPCSHVTPRAPTFSCIQSPFGCVTSSLSHPLARIDRQQLASLLSRLFPRVLTPPSPWLLTAPSLRILPAPCWSCRTWQTSFPHDDPRLCCDLSRRLALSRQVDGAARPLLSINALYHIYLMARIVHSQQGVHFFSDDYGAARTILLSLGCVTIMEVAALKKAALFHARILAAPEAELRMLRTSRRANVGWAQRLIVLVMFILICAPVVARYVCGDGGVRGASNANVCE